LGLIDKHIEAGSGIASPTTLFPYDDSLERLTAITSDVNVCLFGLFLCTQYLFSPITQVLAQSKHLVHRLYFPKKLLSIAQVLYQVL
jgi:hypothetical protein